MRRISGMYKFTILLPTVVSLFFCFHADLSAHDDGYYSVVYVLDGDTFEISGGERVRLIGINTPEVGEECSSQATQRLKELILNKTVFLKKDVSETDRYGRLLRYVYVNGLFVNEELVYDGFAYAVEYPPDTQYASDLEDAQQSAASANRGCLWGSSCPSGCYVHITNTGSKYHAADCRYLYNSDYTICRDEAIDQGYSACSVCGGECDGASLSRGSGDGDGGGGCFINTLMPLN